MQCFLFYQILGLGQNEYSKFRVTVSFKKRSNYTYHKVKFFSFPCQSVWLSHHPRTTIVKIFQSVEVPYVKRSIFSRQFQLCQSSNELLEGKKGFQGSFSVAKVTLQSQMSIHLFVCSSVRPSVCSSSKPLNSLKSSSFINLHSSFIILHSSFIIFNHPSFISRLWSFSACFDFMRNDDSGLYWGKVTLWRLITLLPPLIILPDMIWRIHM